jgi:hypothetical protein
MFKVIQTMSLSPGGGHERQETLIIILLDLDRVKSWSN